MAKSWWFLAAAGTWVVGLGTWQIYKLRRDLDDLKWSTAVNEHNDDSVITPDVGTIQFLKRGGYSIQLEAARYTGDGLYLKGYVGNPTELWVTNLAIKFSATKNLYQYRDDYRKDEISFDFGPQPIGEAQCSPITTLAPGTRQPFDVAIPNVKQTKDGVRIVVVFTGERYSYSP